MRIADLPAPVTAAKVDWLPGTTWLGFTPQGVGPAARAKCEATVQRQMGQGFVLERVSIGFGEPNSGYAADPRIQEERAFHAKHADGLIHVHQLQHVSLPLRDVIGDEDYEWVQNAWSQDGSRNRWSVAFPIVRRFALVGAPKAKDVFPDPVWRRLFHSQNATLRPLDDEARAYIAALEIEEKDAPGFRFALDREIEMAERSEVSGVNLRHLERDLGPAPEGERQERWVKVIRRAAWKADELIRLRERNGTLRCDRCRFDPRTLPELTGVKARSCLDVHHRSPLSEGRRLTGLDDLALLCPTCHRIEHLLMKR